MDNTNTAPHNCLAKCALWVEALLSLVRNVQSGSHLYKQAHFKPAQGGGTKKRPLGNVTEQAVGGLLQEMRADSYAVKNDTPDCHQMFFPTSYISCDGAHMHQKCSDYSQIQVSVMVAEIRTLPVCVQGLRYLLFNTSLRWKKKRTIGKRMKEVNGVWFYKSDV